MHTSIEEAEEEYSLELEKITETIKKEKARLVLLQFPEKMKQYAPAIAEALEEKTQGKTKFLIWLGNCWGACDIPRVESDRLKIDLVIQFGHSAYNYESGVAIFK